MQKARSHTENRQSEIHRAPTACRQTVSGTISLPSPGVLFTFPSRYWFTIGRQVVFSLGRWSSRIPTGFLVSRGTQVPSVPLSISVTGLSPSMARFSNLFIYLIMDHVMTVLQPHSPRRENGLGWFPFARRYLGNHYCFLFLGLLRCFSFTPLASTAYGFS